MKILANAVVFVVAYLLLMIPTYILPYFGSNSAVLHAAAAAAKAGVSPAFWPHLIALILLVVITWFRAQLINKNWIIIFPILGAAFDLIPGLSLVPLVPTIMHLFAIILGVKGADAGQAGTQQVIP